MDSFGRSGFNPNGVECDPEHIASAQPQRCTRQEFEAEIGPDGDRIPRRCEAERDALRCHISRHSREHPLPANFPIIQDTCSNDEIGTQRRRNSVSCSGFGKTPGFSCTTQLWHPSVLPGQTESLSHDEAAQEDPMGFLLNLPQGFSHVCGFVFLRQGLVHGFETKGQDRGSGALIQNRCPQVPPKLHFHRKRC
jgi:hypothetical protein